MMLSFLAKLGELISKISNPLLPVFNKSKYEHIRAYTAGNINIDSILALVVVPLAILKILQRNDVMIFVFFSFGCYLVASIFDFLDSKQSIDVKKDIQ